MDSVYLDFSKAFDMVCDSLLLDEVMCYGLDKPPVRWVGDRLTGCTQRVVVSSSFSNWQPAVLLPVAVGLISPGPGRDTGIPSPVGHALGAATLQGWRFPGPVSERCYRSHVLYIPLSVFFLLFSSFLCCNVKLPLSQPMSFAFFF